MLTSQEEFMLANLGLNPSDQIEIDAHRFYEKISEWAKNPNEPQGIVLFDPPHYAPRIAAPPFFSVISQHQRVRFNGIGDKTIIRFIDEKTIHSYNGFEHVDIVIRPYLQIEPLSNLRLGLSEDARTQSSSFTEIVVPCPKDCDIKLQLTGMADEVIRNEVDALKHQNTLHRLHRLLDYSSTGAYLFFERKKIIENILYWQTEDNYNKAYPSLYEFHYYHKPTPESENWNLYYILDHMREKREFRTSSASTSILSHLEFEPLQDKSDNLVYVPVSSIELGNSEQGVIFKLHGIKGVNQQHKTITSDLLLQMQFEDPIAKSTLERRLCNSDSITDKDIRFVFARDSAEYKCNNHTLHFKPEIAYKILNFIDEISK